MDVNKQTLAVLLAVLDELKSDYVLIGGLVAGYHGRVRATVDVDVLIPRRKKKVIAQALANRGFAIQMSEDMFRAYAPNADLAHDEPSADLVVRESNPVLRAAFEATETATILGHSVKIVQRGAFAALKFHAAVSPRRKLEDRYQDIVDLGRVIAKRFDAEDQATARRIIEYAYPEAAVEMDAMIADLRNGRPVKL